MSEYTQDNRHIRIDTPLGPNELLLQGFHGQESVSRLFQFDLRMHSENRGVRFDGIVGKKATITIQMPGGGKRYINGVINSFSQGGSSPLAGGTTPTVFASYYATLVPWPWSLTRTTDCRIFQNLSVPDIITKIFQEYGFSDYANRLVGSFAPREYCVQYRETDFDFISRLMEEEGIFYFFEHKADKHTLVMANRPNEFKPSPLHNAVSYKSIIGEETSADVITEWNQSQEVRPGKYTLRDYNFREPTLDLTSTVTGKDERKMEVYDYPGEYEEKAQGERLVGLRMEEEETSLLLIQGSSYCRGFTPGYRFDLRDHYRRDFNKSYVLTSVSHSAEQGSNYRSSAAQASESFQYSNQFQCIPHPTPYRPARLTPVPVVRGTQTAVVVGPPGEEIYVDQYGRVKVQFHWDREGKLDENSSCWIRVSHPWAGKGWGAISIPRIGQEVIIDFLEGDPDRPIIVGRVYNAKQMPPFGLPGAMTVSGLKSDTHKGDGFNEMSMDDTAGKEKINIHAQYDMMTTVLHDDTQAVKNNRAITVDGTHTETIKKDTTITVTEGKETNTVKKEIVITSQTAHIHITAATEIKLEVGASKLLMKSDGSIELKGVNIAINGSQSVNTHGASVTTEADMDHNTKGNIVVSSGTATNTVRGGMVMLNP